MDKPLLETGGSIISKKGKGGTSWLSTMFIIIANVMGIGVLGLAHAFSQLGWILGLTVLFACMSASLYSGFLLSRMKNKVPNCNVYADLGQAAWGNLGEAFVSIFSYTFLIGLCFSFHLSASFALKEVANGICIVYCALLVALVVLPLAQYRNLEEMTSAAYVGSIAIAFPIVIIISEIAIQGRYDQAVTSLVSHATFNSAFVACMNVLFAITGQVIFVELMSEMKQPLDFPKSVKGASSVFLIVYTTMATVGYYFIGSTAMNPITNNLTNSTAKRWCAAFVLCHIIVAYVIEVIILARAFERIVLKRKVHEDSRHASYQDRIVWFLVTFIIVIVSFLVCNITPFINDLMGFVGAVCGVTTTYVFPFFFAPIILKDEFTTFSKRCHYAFGGFSIIIAIIGVFASIQQMVHSYQTKLPFEC